MALHVVRLGSPRTPEMKTPDAAHALDLLAALSQHSDIAVGCYCEEEAHCHRKALRELLVARGAKLAGG